MDPWTEFLVELLSWVIAACVLWGVLVALGVVPAP